MMAERKEESTTDRGQVHGFDRESLLTVYKVLSNSRIDYNERKWETVRSAAVLVLGALAAVGTITAGILRCMASLSSSSADLWQKVALSVPLLCLGGILIYVGTRMHKWIKDNLEREAELQYSEEFSMYQIEKLVGLHQDIQEARWVKDNSQVFGPKHTNPALRSTKCPVTREEWLNDQKKAHPFGGVAEHFGQTLRGTCVFIGILLIALGIFIAVVTICDIVCGITI